MEWNKGMEIVNLQRAEEMTDYITTHPRLQNVESVTIDEINRIRDEAIDIGLFTDWMKCWKVIGGFWIGGFWMGGY